MHIGAWGLALIVIVFLSWMFYRYFAPRSWKEWTQAGVVQAFIIAFYAEMYGFPLTIYLLGRFFGLDVYWTEGGNLWAQLFGTNLAHIVAMVIGYAIVFFGLSVVAQGWREIYIARKKKRLATDGLYSVVRHPQYTGFFLIVFGEGIVHWPTIISVALFPVIVAAYTFLALREERAVLAEFGDEYREYQKRVPRFIPRKEFWKNIRISRTANHGGEV